MGQYDALLSLLREAIDTSAQQGRIPLGISNRHVHLSAQDLEALFGSGYRLTVMKELSQPGQYACKECITICGPKGAIEKVRILGPVRDRSQIEIMRGDCFKLGINAPVRMSGDLDGTPGVTLVGPKGSVYSKEGLIIARRHIHMSQTDAADRGVRDGDVVSIQSDGERGGIYHNVVIRANIASGLDCHIDVEEANAMNLTAESYITIQKNKKIRRNES